MTDRRAADSGSRGESGWPSSLPDVLKYSGTRVVFGARKLAELGAIAKSENARRILLVTDPGIVKAGHVERAVASLHEAGLNVTVFDGVEENPTTEHVALGVAVAREHAIDFLIGLGGGSSMDCAKGINFILTGGGEMKDYWGVNKATQPMLPMVAVPTTAGTGSEAQSFALICDPATHQKMACGDTKAACRVALLDPDLTETQPPAVRTASGIDAVSHAVETAGTTKRSEVSLKFTGQAWLRLDRSFDVAMADPHDSAARADMLVGAHLAGAAIEQSMLGAAHACSNPLTARFGITHGIAVGLLLPHVIRFNSRHGDNPYCALDEDPEQLAQRVEAMLAAAANPRCLNELGVTAGQLPALAEEAARQWTAQFNPSPVGRDELLSIYESAVA